MPFECSCGAFLWDRGWFEVGELGGRTPCSHFAKCFLDHLAFQGWVSTELLWYCMLQWGGWVCCLDPDAQPRLEARAGLRVSWRGESP